MKKILLKIHLWLAFPIGLIITVLCLSGAILVFRAEIEEMVYSNLYFIPENGEDGSVLPLHELMQQANEQLDDDTATSITIPSDQRRTYIVSVASDFHRFYYINPYSGKLIQPGDSPSFFSVMFQLHRWLLLNPEKGKPITGWTTLLFVFILLTGAIAVLPKTRKAWMHIYTIHTTKGWKHFWYDMHISVGTYALLILLILALTGLTWSFRWYNRGIYSLLGAEMPAMNRRPQANSKAIPPTNFTHWQSIFEMIRDENTNYKTISLRGESAVVAQKQTWGNARATDQYTFDSKTGEVTSYKPYGEQDKAIKVRGWLYTLHVGAWGGLFSKILTCVVSLAGASLPLTGYYILVKKRVNRLKVRT